MNPIHSRVPSLPLVALALCATASAARAVDLKTFTDRAIFLAETSGASATGPLPDLGFVTSATVGSVTFGIAPGGDNMAIGPAGTIAAPDWYPPLPGNDIALGYENLQVDFAGPVYAFGFEFAQPDATMPWFGGTPVDSTFEITLYDGAVQVAQLQFSSIPTDVVTYLGVWSSAPFTSATIIDVTPSIFVDDNEFFGEFDSSVVPYVPIVLVPCTDQAAFLALPGVIDASGPIPDIGAVSSAKLGSVTIGIAPGGNTLYLGAFGTSAAPDWYPLLPGHDIALGYEALELAFDAPVNAFGIEFAQPDATMPAFGGVPIDSTYELEAFLGSASLGKLVFSNLPVDVPAFLGVCCDTPFDRVTLIDVTPSPFVEDDEFFGRIYTGSLPQVWNNLGSALGGGAGEPLLSGTGPLLAGSSGALELAHATPGSVAVLAIAGTATPVPLFCGTFVAWPPVGIVALPVDSIGMTALPWSSWSAGLSGASLLLQIGLLDPLAPCGVAFSNALRADVP
jgi:hypothetical protein